jgi:Tol biopolymer transport system component
VARLPGDPTDVVYLADQDTDGRFRAVPRPIGGGATTKLNGALPAGGNVLEFNISPDGSRVVYRADQDSLGIDELYSVPIGGGATTKLNGTMTPGGSIVDPGPGFTSFLFTPDSARVIYKADQDTFGIFELYSAPIAGGAVVKLNPTLIPAGDTGNFQTDGVGINLLFTADAVTDQRFELYSCPWAEARPPRSAAPWSGAREG